MTIGQRIKKFRLNENLTQKELGDKLSVTFQAVSKWEKDENAPSIEMLKKISKALSCSVIDLLDLDEK